MDPVIMVITQRTRWREREQDAVDAVDAVDAEAQRHQAQLVGAAVGAGDGKAGAARLEVLVLLVLLLSSFVALHARLPFFFFFSLLRAALLSSGPTLDARPVRVVFHAHVVVQNLCGNQPVRRVHPKILH